MPDIEKAYGLLKKYRKARTSLTNRIIQNEQWYKLRHTQGVSEDRYIPASAWLFNSLAVKHADAMDAIPVPYVAARERSDEDSAEALSKLLPAILERCDFPSVYSAVWNDKLKHGTGCYGVFWNPTLHSGMGDVEIRRIDVLNLFWEPGVSELDASPNLFHCELRSVDELMEQYPQIKEITADPAEESARYFYDDDVDVSDKATVVDWYYKKRGAQGQTVLHYCKFVRGYKLYCTEDYPEYENSGLYAHGRYPFITDVMYGIEGTPCGFGTLDIMKDAQLQIDRLNYAILENAKMSATRRFFIRADGSVSEQEFADWTKPFVHIQGAGLGEDSIREITAPALSDVYIDVINNKITELKETSGNRDVTTGGTEKGVIAAAAINVLQESGSKMTKDMIASSYRAFSRVCTVIVELVRQFYTVPRCVRIMEPNGTASYMSYDNKRISAFESICSDSGQSEVRLPAFDICVSAEKSAVSKREEINAMAMELYSMGALAPENRESARLMLSMMDFDGKEALLRAIDEEGEGK